MTLTTLQSDTKYKLNLTKYRFDVELGDTGMWYATSPDVKGLLVAEHTLDDCLSGIAPVMQRLALAAYLKARLALA
jgi:hypothetical protein